MKKALLSPLEYNKVLKNLESNSHGIKTYHSEPEA
jgi:hypothetical protein